MALAHGLWPFPVLQGLLQQVSACSPETGVCRFWPRCSVSILMSLNSSLTVPSPSCPFQITGVILLAVGVWGKLTLGTYISLIAENSTNAPYVLIGTGTTIVVFGLFGCFATCRGSPWMLKLVSRSQWNTASRFCFVKMQITWKRSGPSWSHRRDLDIHWL